MAKGKVDADLMTDVLGEFEEDRIIEEEYKQLGNKKLGYSSQIDNAQGGKPRPKSKGKPRPLSRKARLQRRKDMGLSY